MTALAHRYEPHGVLRGVFSGPHARHDELLVAGPAGTGKSRATLEKLHFAAMKYPRMRGLMVRKTAVSLTATGLVTFREHVAKEAIEAGLCAWYGGSSQEPAAYRYVNGSSIAVGGMDKPTKIMSSEYDLVYVQEATELNVNDWESITTRLRNGKMPYQQIIADCNPDAPHHWLKKRCDEKRTAILNSRHEDNPRLFNKDGTTTPYGASYIAKLDALTGVRHARLRRGEWVAAEGQVYEQWDTAVHLVDRFEIPDDWARYWAIDFGFTNPFVLQFWAEDPDGRLYLYREIYKTQRTVDEHARHALELVTEPIGTQVEGEHPRDAVRAGRRRWTEPRPRRILADHDAEGRATFAKETGLSTTQANKRKIDGIQAVQRRLRDRRLFILRDSCVQRDSALADAGKPSCTAEEVLSYVWDHKGVTDPKIQEEPVKEDDHGCLVAGTLVTTSRGPIPIESIRMGDQVLTRRGLRRVLAAGMTQVAARTLRVTLENGGYLSGTADHPVWIQGEGFIRMDALRYGMMVECQSQSALVESSFAAIPSLPTGPRVATSHQELPTGRRVGITCTGKSGVRPMEKSRMVTRSTIWTSTHSTMTLAIWRVSQLPSMMRLTPSAEVSEDPALHIWPTSRRSGHFPRSGMQAMRAGPGIASMLRQWVSGKVRFAKSPASSAPIHTRQVHHIHEGASVRTGAGRPRGVTRGPTMNHGSVAIATRSMPVTNTLVSGTVGARVLSVAAEAGMRPVYNLTVEEVPEFYANGVLVHNCDALRYMVMDRDRSAGTVRFL